ncbi:hypothetical protein IJ798_00605 [Candidatus Saccharibacteria bacterium]|nr:hypothetical protein [Candidatus Saccharibacteria bacterium]
MNNSEGKFNFDVESTSFDVWSALNDGESWDDFEKTENWWDDEDEIDWNIDVLSGKKIRPEISDVRIKPNTPNIKNKPKIPGVKIKNVVNDVKISDIKPNFSNGLRPKKIDLIRRAQNSDKARKINIIDMNEPSEDSNIDN